MNKPIKPHWYEQLSETPWNSTEYVNEQIPKVIAQAGVKRVKNKRRLYPVWMGAAAVIILLILSFNGTFNSIGTRLGLTGASSWTVHMDSVEGGKTIFTAHAGGHFPSGQPNGAMWMLHIPYKQIEGSKLRIDGLNKETGMKVIELPETILNSPTFAYNEELTRITSKFDLPVGGLWKFTMYLDGNRLGDVVFDVPQGWELSEEFAYGDYILKGVEGQLAFLDTGLKPASLDKFKWYFWGKTDVETRQLSGKKLVLTAIQFGESESISLFTGTIGMPNSNIEASTPNNDIVAEIPALMSLPYIGVWRLDATIDNKLYGSVYVKVE